MKADTATDLEAIECALALFYDDERLGWCLQTRFFDLEVRLGIFTPNAHKGARRAISHIHHDLWNIAVMVSRLEWSRDLAMRKTLHETLWRLYSQADIESIIVQLRSIMDYSVAVISSFAGKGGQLPDSFRKLRESLDKYVTRLPPGVVPLIREAHWFDVVRTVRDALVHQGAEPLVFCRPDEGTLFQVHGDAQDGLVEHPEMMYNKNVVYFSRFAALIFSHLLHYLDSLGRLLWASSGSRIGPSSSRCVGFEVLREWMIEFRDRLKASPPAVN